MIEVQNKIQSDAEAVEYCRQNANSYLAMFYPAAGDDLSVAEQMLGDEGAILYRKSIELHSDGPYNLIRQIYPCEKWLGGHKDGYKGAYRKAAGCFPEWQGIMTVFLFEGPSLDAMGVLKNKIRKAYGVGNHSIHTSDTHEECVHLAQIFFNDNSVWALNHIRFKPYAKFYKSLGAHLNEQVGNEASCLGVNTLLALTGLKEAVEIDECNDKGIPSNSTRYFYFNGAKIITPHALLEDACDMDLEKKTLVVALANGGVEDKAHERKRRCYQGFYSWILKTRRQLRVDVPRRWLRQLRKRAAGARV